MIHIEYLRHVYFPVVFPAIPDVFDHKMPVSCSYNKQPPSQTFLLKKDDVLSNTSIYDKVHSHKMLAVITLFQLGVLSRIWESAIPAIPTNFSAIPADCR